MFRQTPARPVVAMSAQHILLSCSTLCASLAGLPDEVVSRAKEILAEIEHSDPLLHRSTEAVPQTTSSVRPVDSAILKDLNTLDLNHMTPVDAFLKLHEYLDALRG